MSTPIFTGAGVALVTPFKEDGAIDFAKLNELIDFQIENGTDAIIICGTTGESSTLTHEEHLEAIRFTIEKVAGRIPVIAGTGSNCTQTAIYLSQEAEKDAVQSGYWQLYRYNPGLAEQGKNPFQLDYSKEPNGEFQTLIKGQNRYASLKLSFPEKADGLYEKAEADAKHRFETYKELADD